VQDAFVHLQFFRSAQHGTRVYPPDFVVVSRSNKTMIRLK
jgi:hypothetical protein